MNGDRCSKLLSEFDAQLVRIPIILDPELKGKGGEKGKEKQSEEITEVIEVMEEDKIVLDDEEIIGGNETGKELEVNEEKIEETTDTKEAQGEGSELEVITVEPEVSNKADNQEEQNSNHEGVDEIVNEPEIIDIDVEEKKKLDTPKISTPEEKALTPKTKKGRKR